MTGTSGPGRPTGLYSAALAAALLTGCYVNFGLTATLVGVTLALALVIGLRRAQRAEVAAGVRLHASRKEHLVANLLISLPHLLSASPASLDLYREALSILHELSGDDPPPGRLLASALLLTVQVPRQLPRRARATSFTVESAVTFVEMTGDELRAVQTRLNMLGFDAGQPDGALGPTTSAAIAEFQLAVGLPESSDAASTLQMLQRLHRGNKAVI